MATIFDGYTKASDEQIADQIALLETITLGNVLKPYGQKARLGAVRTIKKVGGLFGKGGDIKEPEVKEVRDVVEENRKKLDGVSRNQLDAKLHKLLVDRSGCTPGSSQDALSAKVIDEAAVLLKISQDLTPAQKADRVYEEFHERVLENLQKELKKQNPQEAQQMARELDIKLHEMSDEQRKKIQEILKVDNLTGESMRGALVKAGAPALILGSVTAAGFGAFVALSTIIHAVFTTILGVTLPFAAYTGAGSVLAFITGPVGWLLVLGIGSWQVIAGSKKIDQEMLAQSVWFAAGSYGKYLTPSDEELPSWVPQVSRAQVEENDKNYAAMVAERDKAIAEARSSADQIKQLQGKISQTESSLESERRKRQNAEQAKKDLECKQSQLDQSRAAAEKRVHELETALSTAANATEEVRAELSQQLESAQVDLDSHVRELEDNRNRLNDQEEIIGHASEEITRNEAIIDSISAENSRLQSENEEHRRREERAKAKAESEEDSRRRQLVDAWEIHFPRFSYQPQLLREAAKLKHADHCALERVLRELHEAKDPHTVSSNRGKLEANGNEHVRVDLSGSQWRVEYRILNKPQQPIDLIRLYKKGQHYMD